MTISFEGFNSLFHRAFSLLDTERHEEGIALCKELVAIEPNSVGALAIQMLVAGYLDKPEALSALVSLYGEEAIEKVLALFEQISPMPQTSVDVDAFLDLIDPHRLRH